MKKLMLSLIMFLMLSNVLLAQSKTMYCYSHNWENSYGSVGNAETTIKFNFNTMTYQRQSNGVTYSQHTITDYTSGTLYGEKYVIMYVYAPGSEVRRVAAYDTYIFEYYGTSKDSPFIIYYLYSWDD